MGVTKIKKHLFWLTHSKLFPVSLNCPLVVQVKAEFKSTVNSFDFVRLLSVPYYGLVPQKDDLVS